MSKKFSFINNISENFQEKRLYLFMIGGSGASIIEPILYYFEKIIEESQYKIIPIFIDRNFNSEILYRSINNIKNYQKCCVYMASNMIVFDPYLYVDDGTLFDGDNNLLKIIDEIFPDDTIAFSYSVSNKDNISVKKTLAKLIRRHSNARIFDLIFLPYFSLGFGNEESIVSEDCAKDNLNNLMRMESIFSNEHLFYVGLPHLSRYVNAKYQRNPFNIVSLILAYSISCFLPKSIKDNNSYHQYGIEPKSNYYSLDDIIPNSSLRKMAIMSDFKNICWNLMCKERVFVRLGCDFESENIERISYYYQNSTRLIMQLGDMTIHNELQILFRKQDSIDYDCIWREFKKNSLGIIKKKHTKESFINEILSYVDKNVMVSSNMVIHEILNSIDEYAIKHWTELDLLYF